MVVLQIIDSLNVGGAEVLAVNIANSLVKRDIESHLCVTRKEGSLKNSINSNVNYFFLKRKRTLDFTSFFKLKSYIKKHKITIIHAHSSSSFIAFCIKILCPKVKIIWHDHYGDSEFLKERKVYPLKIFSYFFDTIIIVNNQLKKWCEDNLLAKKVFFIQNFPVFNDLSKVTNLKGVKGKRIVNLAGFREQKDHINLLEAFKIIVKKYPEWTLHLIGKNYNNEYSNSILQFINEEKLTKNVFLYGVCSDIKYILNQSEIGVLSSKSEGLPISLLEYGLAKICILVTDVGECKSVVKNEISIVSPQRSDKLAHSLLYLIDNSQVREEISRDFNLDILKKYSEEVVIKKMIKIYSS
jgi:glycosyltransferase involved in cell wall biosynthesis